MSHCTYALRGWWTILLVSTEQCTSVLFCRHYRILKNLYGLLDWYWSLHPLPHPTCSQDRTPSDFFLKFNIGKQSCHPRKLEGCYNEESQWNWRRHATTCFRRNMEYEEPCSNVLGQRERLFSTFVVNFRRNTVLFLKYLFNFLHSVFRCVAQIMEHTVLFGTSGSF